MSSSSNSSSAAAERSEDTGLLKHHGDVSPVISAG